MLADRMVIRIFRELFNNCVLIGFKEMTGEKIINAILGAGFIEDHFFLRVSGHVDEPDIIGRIWLETAAAKNAYAGTTNENRFAFVDSKGRRWIIKDGKVKSDIRV